MTQNFDKICRLCMMEPEDKLISLFHSDDDFPGKVMAIIPILKLCVDDGLPEQVCMECVHQVDTCYNFKLQCENVDRMLRKLLKCQHSNLNDQKKAEINECETCLLEEVKDEIAEPEISIEEPCVDIHIGNRNRLHEDEVHVSTYLSDMINDHHKVIDDVRKCSRQGKGIKDENSRNFICDVCGKTFKAKHHLRDHYVSHTGERPFNCDICGKNFALKACLKIHLRIHTGEKPYCCEECGSCFTQNSALRSHMASHSGVIKRFECIYCGKKFSKNNHLKSHIVKHTGEKSFSCNICGKEFGRKDTLKKHKELHSGIKPFSCNICGKCFFRNEHLKDHIATHKEKKPYICLECGKSFANNSRLKEHMPQHTGQRPYPCPNCIKHFIRREHLKYHLNAVHGNQ